MKLAEALSLRADLQKTIVQLKTRLKNCSKVQEGDKPIENPEEILNLVEQKTSELEELIYRINDTNMQTVYEEMTLTRMIAKKDVLTMKIALMRDTLSYVTERESRYSRNEIKYICLLDILKFRKQLDGFSQQLRLLDMKIQSLNWATDLI